MNKVKSLTPMLWTEKLEETINFYRDILGFTVNEHNSDCGWADISKDAANLMLAKPNEHVGFKNGAQFTGTFYFRIENADELWEKLKDKVKVCYAIEDFEWGMREFAIYDNNVYTLQFGHEIN